MNDVGQDPIKGLLARASPMADSGDLIALKRLLGPIPVDAERKASRLVDISYEQSLSGSYRYARTASVIALAQEPKSMQVRIELAARLRTFNDVALLRCLIAASGSLRKIPVPLLLSFAAQMSYLNNQNEALGFLEEAYRADPLYPPTVLARGQVLTYLGRLKEAKEAFEACIRRAPEIAQAHWCLAHVVRATHQHNHVGSLQQRLEMPSLPVKDRGSFAYALHKELDDIGDVDGAWHALEEACRAKRSTLQYDRKDSRSLVDALIEMPIHAGMSSDLQVGRVPIFIVGMHRSGTTLLEQLLDASPQVLGVGELYDFTSVMRHATDHHCKGVIDQVIVRRAAAADLAEAGRRYLAGMEWRLKGQSHFTDKLPSNFLNIGFICQALPQARILHMVRDPVETCFSNLRELFSEANPYSYDQAELADYFIQYRRLMGHWHAVFPGRILDVDYARLTVDPEGVMREVASFCGLEYVHAMSDPRSSRRAVATASSVQVREGIVRREIPKWAPYARQLQPLIAALRQGGIEVPDVPA